VIASEVADRRPLTSLAALGDLFAVGSLSSSVSLFSVSSMEKIGEHADHTNRVTDVSFLNPSLICSSSADQTIVLWNLESNEKSRIEFESLVHQVESHPSGRIFISGFSDGSFAVIDIETRQTIAKMKSNDGIISALSSHSDGALVFCGGIDRIGRLWDLRSMRSVKVLQGHNDRLTCSCFELNGFHVITGSADNSMICWDMRNLKRSKQISGHSSAVSSVAVRGDILLSSSLDLSIKIWSLLDFRSYFTIPNTPSPIVAACFAEMEVPEKPYIVSASRDGSWRFYHEEIGF
jgi:U4/U6 small nuclear ribonucleoprotein PRP4